MWCISDRKGAEGEESAAPLCGSITAVSWSSRDLEWVSRRATRLLSNLHVCVAACGGGFATSQPQDLSTSHTFVVG